MAQLQEKEALLAAGAGGMSEEEREEMMRKERQKAQQAAEKEKKRIEAAMAEERQRADEKLSSLQEDLAKTKVHTRPGRSATPLSALALPVPPCSLASSASSARASK